MGDRAAGTTDTGERVTPGNGRPPGDRWRSRERYAFPQSAAGRSRRSTRPTCCRSSRRSGTSRRRPSGAVRQRIRSVPLRSARCCPRRTVILCPRWTPHAAARMLTTVGADEALAVAVVDLDQNAAADVHAVGQKMPASSCDAMPTRTARVQQRLWTGGFRLMHAILTVALVITVACTDDKTAPRVFESMIDPLDYPGSPHAWPVGEPIMIECWGNAEDRRRTRAAVRARLEAERSATAHTLAVAREEAARWKVLWNSTYGEFARYRGDAAPPTPAAEANAAHDAARAELERHEAAMLAASGHLNQIRDGWTSAGEPWPLTAVTLRTANGTRYGFPDDVAHPDVLTVPDARQVFPVAPWPDIALVESAATANGEYQRALARDPYAIETAEAYATREAASARLMAAHDEHERRDALRVAIQRDALEACAR